MMIDEIRTVLVEVEMSEFVELTGKAALWDDAVELATQMTVREPDMDIDEAMGYLMDKVTMPRRVVVC